MIISSITDLLCGLSHS